MKQAKRDIKYIIKRIIIGVGIAIVLFNAKKCNVYAQDINTNLYFARGSYNASNGADLVYNTNFTNSLYFNSIGRTLYYTPTDLTLSYLDFNILFNGEIPQNGTQKYLHITFYDSINNIYRVVLFRRSAQVYNDITSSTSSYRVNIREKKGNESYCYSGYCLFLENSSGQNANQDGDSALFIQDILLAPNSSLLSNLDSTYNSLVYTTQDASNSIYTSYNTNTYSLTSSLITSDDTTPFNFLNYNWSIVDTNITNLYYNDEEYVPEQDPLDNLTQIDLTGYYGVLIVPKNYQTMLSDHSHTEQPIPGTFHTFLDYSIYTQYCTRTALIDVENVKDILLNNSGVGTGSLASSITGTCPDVPTESTFSYQFDQYSGMKAKGIMVYNATVSWESGFAVDTESNYFGTSYVWYDPTLYNAYLVESFDNFNTTIQFKDYTGTDREVNVESLPNFKDVIDSATEEDTAPATQRLSALWQFIKSPFVFLNKLNTTSCQPINFPFPRTNRNITIQCLSTSVYDRYLPSSLKTIIIIIINGLLFYRCTLSNIDIVTDMLDPEDNKVEVLDL